MLKQCCWCASSIGTKEARLNKCTNLLTIFWKLVDAGAVYKDGENRFDLESAKRYFTIFLKRANVPSKKRKVEKVSGIEPELNDENAEVQNNESVDTSRKKKKKEEETQESNILHDANPSDAQKQPEKKKKEEATQESNVPKNILLDANPSKAQNHPNQSK